MLLPLDPVSKHIVLDGIKFKPEDPDFNGNIIFFAEEPVSVAQWNDLCLQFVKNSVIIYLSGVFYTAKLSGRPAASAIHPSRAAMMLRIRAFKVDQQLQVAFSKQYGLRIKQ